MGPVAQELYGKMQTEQSRDCMSSDMAHFHIDFEMADRVAKLSTAFPAEEFEGKSPAPLIFLEGFMNVDGHELGYIVSYGKPLHAFGFGAGSYEVGDVFVYICIPNNPAGERVKQFFSYRPRDSSFTVLLEPWNRTAEDERQAETMAQFLDLLFTLCCEPRFVSKTQPPRHERRRAAKALGQKALTNVWVKLGWTIGAATRAKGNIAGSAPQKAFHMVRGHWRNYGDRHTPSSERRPGREGWWVWIDMHPSGNPALGEIKHHYQPKLDSRKSAKVVLDVLTARAMKTTVKEDA